jgi:hypothetical protein
MLNPLGHIEIWDVEAKRGSGRMKESCREVVVEAEHGPLWRRGRKIWKHSSQEKVVAGRG